MQEPFTKEQQLDLSIFETEQNFRDVKTAQQPSLKKEQGTTIVYQLAENSHSYYYQSRRRLKQKFRQKKIKYREKTQQEIQKEGLQPKYKLQHMGRPIHMKYRPKSLPKKELPQRQEKKSIEKDQNQQLSLSSSTIKELQVMNEMKDRSDSPQLDQQQSKVSSRLEESSSFNPLAELKDEITFIDCFSDQKQEKKSKKKRKEKQIIAENLSQDQSLFLQSSLSRRVHPFSFSCESVFELDLAKQLMDEDPLEKYRKMDFHTLSLKLVFKGPIKTIKIKGMILSFYGEEQIKIQKQIHQKYSCGEQYQDLIQIIDNVYEYQGRRQYLTDQKQVNLDLCHIKIPTQLINQIFTKENLKSAPISISKISVVCFCTRKAEFVISSGGGTCKNCSLPFQLSINSMTLT